MEAGLGGSYAVRKLRVGNFTKSKNANAAFSDLPLNQSQAVTYY
jgi:hypothetical protein